METINVSRAHTTLDLILFRRFGATGQSLLESVLDANPGLARKGAELPIGTVVVLPERPATVSPGARPVVDLFG
ncbi:tail protein X [Pelagibacterium nitratireducens]|uniref:Tail protein X n=1 Tax=Pelagibacterium nitratireducens TaxID=1046114 RepID=A0ABZ2HUS8_9HYPH